MDEEELYDEYPGMQDNEIDEGEMEDLEYEEEGFILEDDEMNNFEGESDPSNMTMSVCPTVSLSQTVV